MKAKKRYGYVALVLALILAMPYISLGSNPALIKVGLISVYNNAASMVLSSDRNMNMGYFDEGGFTSIGTLPSEIITISKAGETYYDIGERYYYYEAAYEAALQLGGIPTYLDEGLFAVYGTVDNGNSASYTGRRYKAADSSGQVLLIFDQSMKELVFQGYDENVGIPLTKVGSTKKYRGAIGIGGTTGITPYNIVDLEAYLYGVIPGEMSPSWPEEALKAQAVAARSIAIYQYSRYISAGYNVVDTTATQVYGGYTKEDSRTNKVVDETRGETIHYNGKVAEALYFSTSGGVTESAVNVWGSDISYLKSVSDHYETEPSQPAWSRQITMKEVEACLTNQGIHIGTAQGVQIVSRTDSGRVQTLRILGSSGSHDLIREDIRTFFSSTSGGSLRSRLISFSSTGLEGVSGGSTPSSQVAILSSSGQMTTSLEGLTVTNGYTTNSLSGQAVIQSSSGTTVTGSATGSSGGVETVWGDFTVYGKGYGHGVGMSQSGAKGMAKAGFDYRSILQYYYTGVSIY